MDYFFTAFSRCTEFTGRSSRSEYWWFHGINTTLIFGAMLFAFMLPEALGSLVMIAAMLYAVVTCLPATAVTVRRLHDSGKSGWFILAGFIPYVGWLAMLVLCCLESDAHDNEYGPRP